MTFCPGKFRTRHAGLVAILASGSLLVGGSLTASTAAAVGTAPAVQSSWRITTLAGGVGGPGPASQIPAGGCAVTYAGGYLYAVVGEAVRRISMRTGWLSTLAGTGVFGTAASGIPGAGASMGPSCGLAVDKNGNLLFADGEVYGPAGRALEGNDLVRVLAAASGSFYGQSMTAGHIYTVAGNGTLGFSGDGGPAIDAQLADPAGLAVDQSGNIVVADGNNERVRVIAERSGTFYGHRMTAGDIYTVAGGGTSGLGDGGPGVRAELDIGIRFDHSHMVAMPWPVVRVDHAGDIVIADTNNERIRVVTGTTGRHYGRLMKAGYIYTVAGGGARLLGDGGPATRAVLRTPAGIAIDHTGNIVITDRRDERIRVVAVRSGRFYGQSMTAGDIYTVAGNGNGQFSGDGGPARQAGLGSPAGISVDGAGNIVIASYCPVPGLANTYSIAEACLRVVAAGSGSFYRRPMTRGDIYTISGAQGNHFGDGGPALHAQFAADLLSYPASIGIAADPSGDVAFADTGNGRVRMVAAGTGTIFGQAMTAGDIYTVAGNGQIGYSGDDGSATKARIGYASGLAFDQAGNLLITDSRDRVVRVVAALAGHFYGQTMTAGDIYTIAGTTTGGSTVDGIPATSAALAGPSGMAIDQGGNVVFGDQQRIRVVAETTGTCYGQAMTAGDVYTVADIPSYAGLSIDPAGNVVATAHPGGNYGQVDVVAAASGTFYGQAMTAGSSYVIAGQPVSWHVPVGGIPATSAYVQPLAMTTDAAGNVIMPDYFYHRIRIIAASTGTFYGIPMTAGDIYTLAGGGNAGLGDGGPAADATLGAMGVAVEANGDIAVLTPDRVRLLSP